MLLEARQLVPEFLLAAGGGVDDGLEQLPGGPGGAGSAGHLVAGEEVGCAYCGGLGHRITHCPKLEAEQNKAAVGIGRKDYLSFADY